MLAGRNDRRQSPLSETRVFAVRELIELLIEGKS